MDALQNPNHSKAFTRVAEIISNRQEAAGVIIEGLPPFPPHIDLAPYEGKNTTNLFMLLPTMQEYYDGLLFSPTTTRDILRRAVTPREVWTKAVNQNLNIFKNIVYTNEVTHRIFEGLWASALIHNNGRELNKIEMQEILTLTNGGHLKTLQDIWSTRLAYFGYKILQDVCQTTRTKYTDFF